MAQETIEIATAQEALAILQWYEEAGVDEAMEDAPVDYFALTSAESKPKPRPTATATSTTTAAPTGSPTPAASTAPRAMPSPAAAKATASVIAEAKEAAAACDTIEALQKAVEAFEGCPLKKHATNTVFADGVASADVMFIGEAPDGDEDRKGLPFCGTSGQMLDKMLAAIDLDRKTNAYLTNMVFWRPPGNRPPTSDELEICRPFVQKHIALAKPKVLVFVGGVAAKTLLNETSGILRLRGKARHYHHESLPEPIDCYAIFHPTYLASQPAHKAMAWKDLLSIKQILKDKS